MDAILGGVADGIIARAPDGRLVFANEAAARVLGFPSVAELPAAPPGDIRGRFEVMDEAGRFTFRVAERPITVYRRNEENWSGRPRPHHPW